MIDTRHPGTKNPRKSADALQRTLLELQALQLATKQAHWNVTGMLFWSLHEMLDAHYAGLVRMTDTIAERTLSVGSPADGRPRTIVDEAPIADMPGGLLDDTWILSYFNEQYAAVGERIRERVGEIEEDDPTSADLLQEAEHLVEKNQWQMRAHLEAGTQGRAPAGEGEGRRRTTSRIPARAHEPRP